MIYNDELAASLDQIEGVVIFHRVEQTEVQRLAQQLAERAVYMVEQNEKALDMKLGSNQDRGAAGAGTATDSSHGRTERRGGTRGTCTPVKALSQANDPSYRNIQGPRRKRQRFPKWAWRDNGKRGTGMNCNQILKTLLHAYLAVSIRFGGVFMGTE